MDLKSTLTPIQITHLVRSYPMPMVKTIRTQINIALQAPLDPTPIIKHPIVLFPRRRIQLVGIFNTDNKLTLCMLEYLDGTFHLAKSQRKIIHPVLCDHSWVNII